MTVRIDGVEPSLAKKRLPVESTLKTYVARLQSSRNSRKNVIPLDKYWIASCDSKCTPQFSSIGLPM